MSLEIQEYRQEDQERLVEMATGLIDLMAEIDPHKRFRPKEQFDAQKYVESRLKKILEEDGKILVAVIDEKPAGYLMATIEETSGVDALNKFPAKIGSIDALYIDDAYRGQGASTALLEKIEQYFREEGCDYSTVSCVAANEPARSLYTKKGYGEQYIDFLKKL